MDPIKDILSSVMGRMSAHEAAGSVNIGQTWTRISGGHGSRPAELKDGCLTVVVDSSIRMVHLNGHREDLIQELNKDFPAIKKIYFKVGKV